MPSARVPFLLVDATPSFRPTLSMEFRVALFFLFLYYIRPQDWIQGLAGFNIIKPVMAIWLGSLFLSRNRSPILGLFRTPHDWVMLAYFVFIVWNSPDPNGAFSGMLPLVSFYLLTVHSLTDWSRLGTYLKAWNLLLLGVAFIGVASLYGLDFTGAQDATAMNAGRLSIGTWLHNNPNALGHSVVPCIALSYVFYFWKGGATNRLIVFPLCAALATTCAYHTESKGSYLVGAGLLSMIFIVGRPWPVKVLAITMVATMGVSSLSFLPRMSQMGNLRADEGVMGRLMAWEMAKTVVDKSSTGQGWRTFTAWISWEGQTIPKATHSSYVQVGADLGTYGLFLYVAGLWCAAHTLLSAHRFTRFEPDKERCRRALMIILVGYAVSNWMINREYHTEYFLLIAAAAACHRLCFAEILKHQAEKAKAEESMRTDGGESTDPVVPRIGLRTSGANLHAPQAVPHLVLPPGETESGPPTKFWKRLGLLDIGASAALTWSVLATWDYILKNL